MSFAVAVALGKAAFGMVEGLEHYAKLPIMIHVAAVLPTIPLGGWLLLAPRAPRCTSSWARSGWC